jgi:hypothetical protein
MSYLNIRIRFCIDDIVIMFSTHSLQGLTKRSIDPSKPILRPIFNVTPLCSNIVAVISQNLLRILLRLVLLRHKSLRSCKLCKFCQFLMGLPSQSLYLSVSVARAFSKLFHLALALHRFRLLICNSKHDLPCLISYLNSGPLYH